MKTSLGLYKVSLGIIVSELQLQVKCWLLNNHISVYH